MNKLFALVASFLLFLAISCSVESLIKKANIKKPEVYLESVAISDLTLDDLTLQFSIGIRNPNPVSVRLAGIDYQVDVNQNRLLAGKKSDQLDISGKQESKIQLPVTVRFKELFQAVRSLNSSDSSTYQLRSTVRFSLPILGEIDVPLSYTGSIPVIRPPKISFEGIGLESLSFTEAQLRLQLAVDNPNSLGMLVKGFKYQFFVDNALWAEAEDFETVSLSAKRKQRIDIPVNLKISRVGNAVLNLIRSQKPLHYRFIGDFNLLPEGFDHRLTKIHIDETGTASISR